MKDAQARDLRRQIEELRAQLARYAEALEEDLASGREKVAARTREGLAFEKAFSEVSTLLLNHLKAKPEARDLLQDLITAMHGRLDASSRARLAVSRSRAARDAGTERRTLRELRAQERLQLDERLQVAGEARHLVVLRPGGDLAGGTSRASARRP